MQTIEAVIAQGRENKRRARLHRQIAALEAKLEKAGPNPTPLKRQGLFRIRGRIKTLKAQLAQPELPL